MLYSCIVLKHFLIIPHQLIFCNTEVSKKSDGQLTYYRYQNLKKSEYKKSGNVSLISDTSPDSFLFLSVTFIYFVYHIFSLLLQSCHSIACRYRLVCSLQLAAFLDPDSYTRTVYIELAAAFVVDLDVVLGISHYICEMAACELSADIHTLCSAGPI